MRNSSIYLNLRRFLFLALAAFHLLPYARAVDPNRAVSQYIRDRWGPDKGFPSGPVYAIAQTTDGYLWIGTEAGLVRFDGLSFGLFRTTLPNASSTSMPLGQALGVTADDHGGLWIRLRGPELLRYRAGVFEDVDPLLRRSGGIVTVAIRGNPGFPGDFELIFATRRRGVLGLRNGKVEALIPAVEMPASPVISLARTLDGDLWMGTRDQGLFRWHGGQLVPVSRGLPDAKINCLLSRGYRDNNGSNANDLWIGTDRGLVRWDGVQITQIGIPPALTQIPTLAMIQDGDHNVWIGTAKGLFRSNPKGIVSINAQRAITAVFEDREGDLWIGSDDGLERLRDSVFATFSIAESLPSANIGPILATGDRTWFAPVEGGLYFLRDGKVTEVALNSPVKDVVYSIAGNNDDLWLGRQHGGLTHLHWNGSAYSARNYTTSDGLAQNAVFAVSEGRDGTVWAATLNSGVSRLRDGHFTTYTKSDGLAVNSVAAVLETADGAVWFATPAGLSTLSNQHWRTVSNDDGLPSENVNCLFEDSTGTLWVGTLNGLAFIRSGSVHVPPGTPQPLHEQIFAIAEDKEGWLWITTENHVLRVHRDRLLSGALGAGDVRQYQIVDGLASLVGVKRSRSAVADPMGRIWLSMTRGLSVVDVARLSAHDVPTLAIIKGITADGDSIPLNDSVRIPAGRQRISFEFAGISLSIPDRTLYRYTLENFDHGWSAPTATREAAYTNLGPGSYRLRVVASDLNQVFNSPEATLAFQIEPTYWQTWWFRLAVALSLALAVAAFFRIRMNRLAGQMKLRFEERIAERTRIAQELHDTLLQGFLSASMQLHVAADSIPGDSPMKNTLERILALMRRVIDEGRNALRDLRLSHGNSLDLENAFSHIPAELGARGDIGFRIIVEGHERPLHPILRDEVYRIGREALVNAFRHSHATSVEVELEYTANEFRLLVRDNGCGVDPLVLESGREGHWGLSGMRERAERIGARLHLRSRPHSGTEVELSVPGHVAFKIQLRRQFWFFGRGRK